MHDVRNFKLDLDKYLASLSNDKRNDLMKPILKLVKAEARSTITPILALYTGTMSVMFELFLHNYQCENRELRAKLDQLQSQLYERDQSNAKKE